MSILHLSIGESLKEAIKSNNTILLASGRHKGGVTITRDIKIIGEIGAVIEGDGTANPTICIAEDGIEVTLSGISIEKGAAEFGSGVLIDAYAEVTIDGCRFKDNFKGSGGGVGIGILLGNAKLKDCRFEQEQDAFVSNIGEASFVNCAILGGMSAYDGAQVYCNGGEIQGKISMRGSSSRKPTVSIDGTSVDGIENHRLYPGQLIHI